MGEKGSENHGIRTGPEGSDKSQKQGHVQPDKAAADLLWSGRSGGSALLPSDQADAGLHHGSIADGCPGPSVLSVCHV